MNDTDRGQINQHKTPDISYSHKPVIVIARLVSH